MSILLTSDEIAEITAYQRPKQQIEELARQGIPFRVNRYGKPLVAREAALQVFGVKRSGEREQGIDLDALNEATGNGQNATH
mgnify:CR=1 FL=1